MPPDVVVVGGGAAGIMAAWKAASDGAEVLLLEKSPRLGTKILISGGGKCNICHDGHLRDVLKTFEPEEAAFLRPSVYRFTNEQIVSMLTSRGLEVYTRPDGRIFPTQGTAKDVVRILSGYLSEAGVKVACNTPVSGIEYDSQRATGVHTRRTFQPAKTVIIATGGASFPATGTTGDAYGWLRALGHTIVPIRAALAPIVLKEDWGHLAGLALRGVTLKARSQKEIDKWSGDILFSHHGITGPATLEVSKKVAEHLERGAVTLSVDLAPSKNHETLSEWIQTEIRVSPRKKLANILADLVPERFAEHLLSAAQIQEDQMGHNLAAKDRNRLVECIKGFPLGEAKEAVLERGEVVAGGVDLAEVDPASMRSNVCRRGLYVCGEALNIQGRVGGYNLQAAFSTGFVAGEAAAKEAMTEGFTP